MKLRKVLAFILAAAMLLGLCAGCGQKPEEMYDEAMEAIESGDAAKGEELLTKAAEKDYVPASAALGLDRAAQALEDLAAEPEAEPAGE